MHRPLEHDIRGLHVAVDELLGVEGVQPRGDLVHDPHCLVDRKRACGKSLGERRAVHERHRQVAHAAIVSGLEHGNEMSVPHLTRNLRLPLEAAAVHVVAR